MPLSDVDDNELDDRESGEDFEDFSTDIFDMSDDDLEGMTNEQIAEASRTPVKAESGDAAKAASQDESDEEDKSDDEDESTDAADKDADDDETIKEAAKDGGDSDSDDDEDKSEESKEKADSQTDEAKKEAEGDEPKAKAESKDDSAIDYKVEYEKLLAPFKANGRQIQVDNVDDAVTLMKMGANYNKKMAALKPSLKVVKMLQENDLLDENKINHLIDLSKHDAGAVTKLLNDAKIDPLEIDSTKNADYKPKDHQVNDAQFELDQVLDELKDNDSFPKTIDVISNQWDEQSKKMALNDPRIISVIDEQIQSGVYDQIVTVMERERMVGRLTDIADLTAYMEIGKYLTQQGELVTQNGKAPQPGSKDTKDPEAEAKRESKRDAAASTKKTAPKKTAKDFNPLDMSDEEFEKQSAEGVFR